MRLRYFPRMMVLRLVLPVLLVFVFSSVRVMAQSPSSGRLHLETLFPALETALASNDTSMWSKARQAVVKAESYGSDADRIRAWRLQGEVYRSRALYSEALYWFLKALELADRLGLEPEQGRLTRLAGISCRMMEDFPKALLFYERSLHHARAAADSSAVMNAHNNLASIQFLLRRFEASLKEIDRLESMAIRLGAADWRISAIRLRGLVAAEQGRLDDSIRYQEEALRLVRATGPRDRILLGLTGLQLAYARAGRIREGLALGREAAVMAAADSNFVSLETVWEHQAMLHEAAGHLDSAYRALKKRQQFRERSVSVERARSAAELEARYELGRKEAAIGILETRNRLQDELLYSQQRLQMILGVLMVMAIAVLGLLYSRFRMKKKGESALRAANGALEAALVDAHAARQEAEHALALKNELLGIAAHDLKNPLSAIYGLSELLKTDPPPPAETVAIAERIHRSSARMYKLVVDLLHTAAADEGRLELRKSRFLLGDLLHAAAAGYSSELQRKNQRLRCDPAPDILIEADAERLAEVFDNLISNAVKYTPAGGEIRISTAAGKAGMVEIRVTDSGPGLEPGEIERLFQRFQRGSALPTGGESSTGLGLSIVRRLVELHGGSVRAESAGKGKGSTFVVELPLNTA